VFLPKPTLALIINFLPALVAHEKILNLKPFRKKKENGKFFYMFFCLELHRLNGLVN